MEVPGRSAFELGLGRFAAGLDRRSVSIPHAHRLPGPEAGVHRGHPSWSCRLSRASLHLPRLFATELASHRAHTRELRVNRNVATYPGGYVRGMAVGRRTETTGRSQRGHSAGVPMDVPAISVATCSPRRHPSGRRTSSRSTRCLRLAIAHLTGNERGHDVDDEDAARVLHGDDLELPPPLVLAGPAEHGGLRLGIDGDGGRAPT